MLLSSVSFILCSAHLRLLCLTVVIIFYVVKIVSGELFRMFAAVAMACLAVLPKN
jgi:hypothetical protein